jgi:putative oxidoreductase
MKKTEWIIEILAGLIVLLFLYTALSKLVDLRHFVRAIDNQPFDNRYTTVLVIILPAAEILSGLLLLVPRLRLAGFAMSAILMLAFTGYVALVTFHFYERVPCACAGVFDQLTWPQHLIFNAVFLLANVMGFFLQLSLKPSRQLHV